MSLAVTPSGKTTAFAPGHLHLHVLGFLLDQRLRRQNVFHFRRTDTVRQAPKAPWVDVGIAAYDRHAGQGEPLFGADNVDNALPLFGFAIVFHAEIGGILRQSLDLNTAFRVRDALGVVGGGDVWSTTASVRSGVRTVRFVIRRP